MSRWTHAICAPCWNKQHPDRPVETTVRIREQYRSDEVCCFCGQITSAGIFVRADPATTPCQGKHAEEIET